MAKNLKPDEIYEFIVSDFQDVWNSVAWNPSARGRGNFMFAIQAMSLLEFACRLCNSVSSGKALQSLSKELYTIEKRYFIRIPGMKLKFGKQFILPYTGPRPTGDELLWALFDIIRNGVAHQYQQMLVRLKDGKDWGITLTGPIVGRHLKEVEDSLRKRRPLNYLGCSRDRRGDLWMAVDPAILFLDVRAAIKKSRLLKKKGLTFTHLERPDKKRGKVYNFDSLTLEKSLAKVKRGKYR